MAKLPSSLTRVLPFALVYSTHLPESVCGTGTRVSSFRSFSWQQGSTHLRLIGSLRHLTSTYGFSYRSQRLTCNTPTQPIVGWPTSLRPLIAPLKWFGNVDPMSITYASRPRLRTRLTRRGMTWRRKPWTYGEHGSHMFYATHACILTSVRSSRLSSRPSPPTERSPTAPANAEAQSFGTMLSPVKFSAQDHLTSELLRTL